MLPQSRKFPERTRSPALRCHPPACVISANCLSPAPVPQRVAVGEMLVVGIARSGEPALSASYSRRPPAARVHQQLMCCAFRGEKGPLRSCCGPCQARTRPGAEKTDRFAAQSGHPAGLFGNYSSPHSQVCTTPSLGVLALRGSSLSERVVASSAEYHRNHRRVKLLANAHGERKQIFAVDGLLRPLPALASDPSRCRIRSRAEPTHHLLFPRSYAAFTIPADNTLSLIANPTADFTSVGGWPLALVQDPCKLKLVALPGLLLALVGEYHLQCRETNYVDNQSHHLCRGMFALHNTFRK